MVEIEEHLGLSGDLMDQVPGNPEGASQGGDDGLAKKQEAAAAAAEIVEGSNLEGNRDSSTTANTEELVNGSAGLNNEAATGETQTDNQLSSAEVESDHPKPPLQDEAKDASKPEDIDPKEHFKNGEFLLAKEGWQRQLKSVNYIISKVNQEGPSFDEKKMNDFREIQLKANLNLALVSLKLREYGDSVTYGEAALKMDPTNPKARYRKALGQFEQGLVEDARLTLTGYPKGDGDANDPAVEKLKRDIATALRRRKLVMRSMFESLDKESKAEAKSQQQTWLSRLSANGGWWLLAGGAIVTMGVALWMRNSIASSRHHVGAASGGNSGANFR